MNLMVRLRIRDQTAAEEAVNALIHVLALLLIVAAVAIAWPDRPHRYQPLETPAAAIYLTSMLMLYTTSAIYHAYPSGRVKRFFMKLDYCTIYLFIAGSYTPFAMGVLYGHGGLALLFVIWILAGVGVTLQLKGYFSHSFISTAFYLAMGWSVLAVAWPLFHLLPTTGLAWVLAGALLYTSGVAFFLMDSRLKFGHSIWHFFVLAGSACHFVAITWYG